MVFAISDNGISISLKDSGWLDQHANQWNMEKFFCDGSSIVDVHDKSKRAIDYARLRGKPALLVFKNLSRRFGHASTDRQAAYLSQEEIQAAAETNHLLGKSAQTNIAPYLGVLPISLFSLFAPAPLFASIV